MTHPTQPLHVHLQGLVGKGRDAEGQCSRCKRCLQCCAFAHLKYTCAWRDAKKTPDQQLRSTKAYERWAADPRMLGNNRRIT
jgi:hypothetical protein